MNVKFTEIFLPSYISIDATINSLHYPLHYHAIVNCKYALHYRAIIHYPLQWFHTQLNKNLSVHDRINCLDQKWDIYICKSDDRLHAWVKHMFQISTRERFYSKIFVNWTIEGFQIVLTLPLLKSPELVLHWSIVFHQLKIRRGGLFQTNVSVPLNPIGPRFRHGFYGTGTMYIALEQPEWGRRFLRTRDPSLIISELNFERFFVRASSLW